MFLLSFLMLDTYLALWSEGGPIRFDYFQFAELMIIPFFNAGQI